MSVIGRPPGGGPPGLRSRVQVARLGEVRSPRAPQTQPDLASAAPTPQCGNRHHPRSRLRQEEAVRVPPLHRRHRRDVPVRGPKPKEVYRCHAGAGLSSRCSWNCGRCSQRRPRCVLDLRFRECAGRVTRRGLSIVESRPPADQFQSSSAPFARRISASRRNRRSPSRSCRAARMAVRHAVKSPNQPRASSPTMRCRSSSADSGNRVSSCTS